ncbi:hypothetical protein GOV13_04720 [Candidatus Pacearchaeota archaeon]|nr:hypothetical protein [Candidatus Pacearchaeota archaeon]
MAARDWNIENIVNTSLIRSLIRINVPGYINMIQRHLKGDVPAVDAEVCKPFERYKGGFFIPGGFVHPGTIITRGGRINFNETTFESKLKQIVMEDNATLLYPNRFEYNCNLNNGAYSKIALSMLNLGKSLAAPRQRLSQVKPKKYTAEDICKSYDPSLSERKGYGAREVICSCLASALTKRLAYVDLCETNIPLSATEADKLYGGVRKTSQESPGTGSIHLYNPFVIWCHTSRILPDSLSGLIQITGPKFGQFATISLEYLGDDMSIPGQKIFASIRGNNYGIVLRKYPKTKPGERTESTRRILLERRRFGLNKVTDGNISTYSVQIN